MKLISSKEYRRYAELKGFYGSTPESNNATNEYLSKIAALINSARLPAFTSLTRDQIKNIYEGQGPVAGVVDYIAKATGEMFKFLELRKVKPDGTYEYVDKHWINDIMKQPNDRYNTKRFGVAWAVNRLLYDDAFVYAPIRAGKDRKATEMYVLSGNKVAQVGGGIEEPFKAIKYAYKTENINFKNNIFESFGYNLDDTSIFGSSKIAAAATYLSMMDKGVRRQDTALENGGVAGIVSPKGDQFGIKPSDADKLTGEFNDSTNINKIKAVGIPVEYSNISTKPIDLDIFNAHKEAVTVLCFLFNVPLDLYYGQSKYENAKEAKKAIYQIAAIPLAEEFGADLISYAGLDRDGYELVVNQDEVPALQDSPTDKLTRLNLMHASLNELRTANGYDGIDAPYADEPMLPLNVQFGNEASIDINESAV